MKQSFWKGLIAGITSGAIIMAIIFAIFINVPSTSSTNNGGADNGKEEAGISKESIEKKAEIILAYMDKG